MEKILHLTDTHLFADGEGELRGTRTSRTLTRVLDHVREHHADASALMVTGDLVQQETGDAYRHFIAHFGDFRIPVLCLPGNHDDPRLMRALLSEPPFRLDFRVRLGAWDIIQLDSHVPGEAGGEIGQTDLDALDRLLRDNAGRPSLVAVHHQPEPVGTPWLDGVGLRDGEQLMQCIEAHAHVKAVVWGHVHQAAEYRRGALRMLGTPSTCAQFLPGSERFAVDPEAPPAYRILWLMDDGTLDQQLIELPEAIDSA